MFFVPGITLVNDVKLPETKRNKNQPKTKNRTMPSKEETRTQKQTNFIQ